MYRQLHLALLYLVLAPLFLPAPPPPSAPPEGPGAWAAITEAWPDLGDPSHREARRRECLFWLAYLRYGAADPGTPCGEDHHDPELAATQAFLEARLAELEAAPRAPLHHPALAALELQVETLLEHAEARLEERRAAAGSPGPPGGWLGRPGADLEELAAAVEAIRGYRTRFAGPAPRASSQ